MDDRVLRDRVINCQNCGCLIITKAYRGFLCDGCYDAIVGSDLDV